MKLETSAIFPVILPPEFSFHFTCVVVGCRSDVRDQPCGSSSSPKVFQATEASKFLCTLLNLCSKSKLLPTLISVYKLPTQLMHELCSLYFSVTGGPVSHQPICYVVRLHHLSGVTVTAW